MSSLLYHNIAGGGRRDSSRKETSTLRQSAGDASWTHPVRRRESQKDIFCDQPPKLKTAIKDSDIGRAVIGSQLLAAVKENPAAEDLGQSFFAATFASHLETETRQKAQSAIAEAVRSLVHDDPPLAVAASPLALTEIGSAANQTGLSPMTARRLLGKISEVADDADLPSVASSFLQGLADAPEQQNANLTKTVANARSRFVIKPADFAVVIVGWLSGVSLDQLFHSLPAN